MRTDKMSRIIFLLEHSTDEIISLKDIFLNFVSFFLKVLGLLENISFPLD